MNTIGLLVLGASLATSACFGQSVIYLDDSGNGTNQNQELLNRRNTPQTQRLATDASAPRVVVFAGDSVIPHFIDGGGWQTSVTVINLENHSTEFDVLFFTDNGADFFVPIAGRAATARAAHITLGTAGSFTFETAGTAKDLAAGWALVSQANKDSVGAFAIFRSSPGQGQQPQEAVVPVVNQFSSHFLLPFDNTAQFVTGVALANPTTNSVSIPVSIRNEAGQIIDSQKFTLGPYAHAAFVLPTTWRSTAGTRGTVEFLTSGFGVGALGLRFNGSAFTSLNVLQNFNWVVTK